MILLAAPIGILARTLWFPPEGLAARSGRKLGARTIVLLLVYLFAFLSISLSKAALLAFGLAVLASIVFLGPRLLTALRTHRLASLAALAAVCVVAIHPASELLGGYVPASVKRHLPDIDWSAAARVFRGRGAGHRRSRRARAAVCRIRGPSARPVGSRLDARGQRANLSAPDRAPVDLPRSAERERL